MARAIRKKKDPPPIPSPEGALTTVSPKDAPTGGTAKCYILRVRKDVYARLTGVEFVLDLKDEIFFSLITRVRPGDRILLVAWDGQATDKAKVVKVLGVGPSKDIGTSGYRCVTVEQTWGWKSNAPSQDTLLAWLSLKAEPLVLPVFGAENSVGAP